MNAIRNLICSSTSPLLWNRISTSSSTSSYQFLQQRFKSKYLSKSATKRLPMTTKRAGKGFYKGKGGTKEGRITSKGRFIVDWSKRLQLMVPDDMDGFKLKPYIASTASKFEPESRRRPGQVE